MLANFHASPLVISSTKSCRMEHRELTIPTMYTEHAVLGLESGRISLRTIQFSRAVFVNVNMNRNAY